MTLVAWCLVVIVCMVGLALCGISDHARRRRYGWLAATGSIAVLLAMAGADVLTCVWLVVGCGVAGIGVSTVDPVRDSQRFPSPEWWVFVGVVAGVLFAALDLVIVRVGWHDLAAAGFRAQAAEIGGRLLTSDLALLGGASLLLTVVLVVQSDRNDMRRGEESP